MKKIIILSDAVEPRLNLVSHLKKLFPECEIQILPHRSENIEERMIIAATVFSKNKFGETVI
jgi:late competence protein required for DNA uptake (superfamily II DNA/RNA helicase)